MTNRSLRSFICALAASGAMALSSAANAGFYGSAFDPLFFAGTAVFQIGDNCLSFDGIRLANVLGCTSVDLQASPAPSVQINPTSGPFLDFSSFLTSDSADMLSVAVIGGKAVGIDTLPVGGFQSLDPTDYPGYFFIQWVYQPIFSSSYGEFSDSYQGPSTHGIEFPKLTSVVNTVLLYDCPTDRFTLRCTLEEPATHVQFSAIPEPGTLALLLGACGAGWVARRRNKAS